MADIAAIRTGLAAKLATVTTFTNGVLAQIPGDINPPCAVVRPAPGSFVQYVRTTSGTVEALFVIQAVVSAAWTPDAQTTLDALISTGAVEAALLGTVSGVSDFAQVIEAQNYGDIEVAGVPYFGVDFVVEVSTL